jgi:2-polyprenyl-3-methyl-5-hydroxy-6-metoxy-1,4-benzoquinol methylase
MASQSHIALSKAKKYFESAPATDSAIIDLRKKIVLKVIDKPDRVLRIVDIGCGNGSISGQFAEYHEVTFVDFSKRRLDEAKKKFSMFPRTYFVNSSLESYEPHQKKYDLVFCIGVLAHVGDIDNTLKKLSELVCDDGKIIIQFTDHDKLISRLLSLKIKIKKIYYDSYGYSTNKTNCMQIKKNILKNNLDIKKYYRYFPSLPLFRFLPESIHKIILTELSRNRLISRFASEVIWVLEVSKQR